jgi:hypothetical protein
LVCELSLLGPGKAHFDGISPPVTPRAIDHIKPTIGTRQYNFCRTIFV